MEYNLLGFQEANKLIPLILQLQDFCKLSAFLGSRVGVQRNANRMVKLEVQSVQSQPLHRGPRGVRMRLTTAHTAS